MATLPPPPPGFEDQPQEIAAPRGAGSFAKPLASHEPPPPPGFEPVAAPGLAESFARGAAEGATFGFDDKLGLDKNAREASRKANPWTHLAGEVAGGFLPMTAAAILPTGAGQAATAGRGAQMLYRASNLAKAALAPGEINSLGQAVKQGAKVGAVYTGLSGAGHANVDENDTTGEALAKRATEGVKGAGIGLGMGAALGPVAHGVFKAGQGLGSLKALASGETADAGQGALRTMANRLERDRLSPQDLIDQINNQTGTQVGPLNIVDRAGLVRKGAGDNTQMTMRAAAATPGEHVGVAREALLDRQIGAGQRLGSLFDRVIGSGDYEGVATKHASDLENAGKRAYAQAYANEAPFDLTPTFQGWMQKYSGLRGPIPDQINGALGSMLNKGKPPQDLESFILARQGLYDAIQGAKREGKGNLSSRLTELYNDMTNEVGKANPLWLEANSIWRNGKAAEEALEAGSKLTTRLGGSSRESVKVFTDAEAAATRAQKELDAATNAYNNSSTSAMAVRARAQMQTAQAKLDAAQSTQDLYRVGVVRSLNDKVANAGETHDLTRQLSTKGSREILGKILGKDAPEFFQILEAEQAMHRTYKSQFGSQTTPLREHIDELNWAPALEASWKSLGLGHALKLAEQATARTINAKRNKDLMRLYTETDPQKQLDALKAAQSLHQTRSSAGNLLGKPALGTIAPLGEEVEAVRNRKP